MSTSFRLLLPSQFVTRMFNQALKELPNECCGLLAGPDPADGLAQAESIYPLTNAAKSEREYLSDPEEMFHAQRDMRRRGIEILAVYHSHPTSDPLPSAVDRERSYSPDVVHFIISLKTGKPVMRGWWLTPESESEAEWQVVEESNS